MAVADEYRLQRAWRSWPRALARLPLVPGQRVLDLGCGIGDLSAELAARGAQVVGLDSYGELLAAARARQLRGVEFREADLASWSEPALGCDGLWCSFAAAYFVALAPALRRWCAALRPGAWVLLVEIDELFGHAPLAPEHAAAFASYCDEAARLNRYDFRMGRRLAAEATAAGLELLEQFELPDRELAFDGPALPEVAAAWKRRFERMSLLREQLAAHSPGAAEAFLACLAKPEHRASARVLGVLARVPLAAPGAAPGAARSAEHEASGAAAAQARGAAAGLSAPPGAR